MGGASIVPRSLKTMRNPKNFQVSSKVFLKSYMTLLYSLIIDFPKFDPLTAIGVVLSVNLEPKCQNLYPLFSD